MGMLWLRQGGNFRHLCWFSVNAASDYVLFLPVAPSLSSNSHKSTELWKSLRKTSRRLPQYDCTPRVYNVLHQTEAYLPWVLFNSTGSHRSCSHPPRYASPTISRPARLEASMPCTSYRT